MFALDASDLPPLCRIALAAAVNSHKAQLARRRATWLNGVLIALGAAVIAFVAAYNFGDPWPRQWQGTSAIGWYALGVAAIASAIVRWGGYAATRRALGFAPGVYVVGTYLIDARTRRLRLRELYTDRPRAAGRAVRWHGFSLAVAPGSTVQVALEMLGMAADQSRHAAAFDDLDMLLAIDPIAAALRLRGPDAPVSPGSSSARGATMAVVLATLLLAPTLWAVRRHFDLEARFGTIKSVWDARMWVEGGGNAARGYDRETEIGCADALDQHPDDLGALTTALRRYRAASHEQCQPLVRRVRGLIVEARDRALARVGQPVLRRLVDRVDTGVANGTLTPVVRIAVRPPDIEDLRGLDRAGVGIPISGYFVPVDTARPLAPFSNEIQYTLEALFPSEMFAVVGPDDPYASAPCDGCTTITVSVSIRPAFVANQLVLSRQPDGRSYPGITFDLDVHVAVPRAAPEDLVLTSQPVGEAVGSPPARFYGALADQARTELQTKLTAALR